MSGSMTAKRLRIVLLVAMLLIVVAVGGGFVFAHRSLTGYATQISQLNADADSGDQSIATYRDLEKRLDQEQATIETAQSVVADNSSFAEQVVGDVTRIAAQSGVSITSLEYVDTGATSATPVTTTPVATPTVPGATAVAPAAGVTKKSISVTINSPVNYTKLLNFIKNIEANKLKLQIATVTLTKDAADTVATQTFSIGAYVR